MKRTVIFDGQDFQIEYENKDRYELVKYAPDGEGTRIIISKKDCSIDAQGNIRADHFEIDGHYR
ncbi:hypothetical protein [Paenibacillus turpanensis]|uniref:hypothetical protein n=1 Tax=Paenibacillus turpanensis TaxID=2689078 RepID=UPI00140BD885|nr:hypothetical protein [Paenibacillus turpanensis]